LVGGIQNSAPTNKVFFSRFKSLTYVYDHFSYEDYLYIEDTKEALESYKKEYSQYWNGILSGTGELTLEETTDDISE